jgi:hypothetical protein
VGGIEAIVDLAFRNRCIWLAGSDERQREKSADRDECFHAGFLFFWYFQYFMKLISKRRDAFI